MSFLETLLQQIANGLITGIGYVLVALGLTLILGILDIINFAHGEFYMLGAVFTYILTKSLGFSYFVSVLAATAVVMLIGGMVERIALRPIYGRDPMSPLLVTFAVSLLFISLVQIAWGSTPQKIASPLEETLQVGPVFLTEQKLFILSVGAVMVLVLHYLVRYSKLGKMMRAVAQNRNGAMAVGIDINRIYTATFMIGSGITAFSAALLAPTTFVTPVMGEAAVIKAFAVVILGGMGSIYGAIAGGLLLGIMESLGSGFVSSALKDLLAFSVIVIVLLLKPSGIFARKGGFRP